MQKIPFEIEVTASALRFCESCGAHISVTQCQRCLAKRIEKHDREVWQKTVNER